ncbi:MAG: hypothetical protein IKG91_07600 [Firmicutes bacterium]|nr:hypothetical protein [Bacillota bacterium]
MTVERCGYDPSLAVQSAEAKSAMVFLLCWLPAILGIVMIVCLAIYKLDKKYPQIQKELEERRSVADEKTSVQSE